MSEEPTPYGAGLSPAITQASVKVMRSHDYCHFEVQLSTSFPPPNESTASPAMLAAGVDDLRKTAARLVDKAVEQYKKAKEQLELQESLGGQNYTRERMAKIAALPEGERTPAEQAELKHWKDLNFRASRRYDYQDDFDERDFNDSED